MEFVFSRNTPFAVGVHQTENKILRLLLEASSAITLQTRERRLKTETGGKNMVEAKNILASEPALGLVSALMTVNPIRKQALKMVEKKFYRAYVEENVRFPQKVQEDKFMMARNMMWAIDQAIETGNISPSVLPKFLSAFGKVCSLRSVVYKKP